MQIQLDIVEILAWSQLATPIPVGMSSCPGQCLVYMLVNVNPLTILTQKASFFFKRPNYLCKFALQLKNTWGLSCSLYKILGMFVNFYINHGNIGNHDRLGISMLAKGLTLQDVFILLQPIKMQLR